MIEAHAADNVGDKFGAEAWLRRSQISAKILNYSGTFVYQQANQVRTSRITHVLDGKDELEKLEVLDGKPREFIRTNDEIISYVPESKTLLIEKRLTTDVFPAIVASNPAALTVYYNIKKGESGRVAGHDCQIILLEPRDSFRYGYKLWVDQDSGLLLRAQTLSEKRELIEQISFSQVEIGRINRNRVKPSFSNTTGWHIENAVMRQVEASGWVINFVPPGFKKIREIKRLISDSSAHNPAQQNTGQPSQREVSQIVFSDGLAAISIFIEPSTMNRAEGYMQQGATNIVGKRRGEFWLTIVGEIPSTAIKQVANSIELKPK